MAKKEKPASKRPFTTDYGTTKGHCETKEGALASGLNKIVRHGLKHVTIEGPNGRLAAIRRTSFWGIFIEPKGGKTEYVPGSGHEPVQELRVRELRSVK